MLDNVMLDSARQAVKNAVQACAIINAQALVGKLAQDHDVLRAAVAARKEAYTALDTTIRACPDAETARGIVNQATGTTPKAPNTVRKQLERVRAKARTLLALKWTHYDFQLAQRERGNNARQIVMVYVGDVDMRRANLLVSRYAELVKVGICEEQVIDRDALAVRLKAQRAEADKLAPQELTVPSGTDYASLSAAATRLAGMVTELDKRRRAKPRTKTKSQSQTAGVKA